MGKVGFIAKVKGRNKHYYYLRVSFWEKEKLQPKNKNLYSFGHYEKATESIAAWIKGKEPFPKELTKMGYSVKDAEKWIQEIEK